MPGVCLLFLEAMTDSLIKAYTALTFSPVAVGSSGLGFKHSLSLSVAKFRFDSASNFNTCTVLFYFLDCYH